MLFLFCDLVFPDGRRGWHAATAAKLSQRRQIVDSRAWHLNYRPMMFGTPPELTRAHLGAFPYFGMPAQLGMRT